MEDLLCFAQNAEKKLMMKQLYVYTVAVLLQIINKI